MADNPSSDLTGPTLIFYTRSGCHLCDVAKKQLEKLGDNIPFQVEVRDVDKDEGWTEQFGDEVPVGILEGRKVFKYRIDMKHLERALQSTRALL
jgi:glutaredoxin